MAVRELVDSHRPPGHGVSSQQPLISYGLFLLLLDTSHSR